MPPKQVAAPATSAAAPKPKAAAAAPKPKAAAAAPKKAAAPKPKAAAAAPKKAAAPKPKAAAAAPKPKAAAAAPKPKAAPKAKSVAAKKATPRCSVRKLFGAIDADHSGEITLKEITAAFKEATADKKTKKSLTYPELTAACTKPRASSARRGGGCGIQVLPGGKAIQRPC